MNFSEHSIEYARVSFEDERDLLMIEVDIQRQQFPEIYQTIPAFLNEARTGRVYGAAYRKEFDSYDRSLDASLPIGPCGCFYGGAAKYGPDARAMRDSVVRASGGKLFHSIIEWILFDCEAIEENERGGRRIDCPLSPNNPLLVLLTDFLEQHWNAHQEVV